MTTSKSVRVPVRGAGDVGYSDDRGLHGYLDCQVDADGTVRRYDDAADHYTIHHGMSAAQVAEARRLAGIGTACGGLHVPPAERAHLADPTSGWCPCGARANESCRYA